MAFKNLIGKNRYKGISQGEKNHSFTTTGTIIHMAKKSAVCLRMTVFPNQLITGEIPA